MRLKIYGLGPSRVHVAQIVGTMEDAKKLADDVLRYDVDLRFRGMEIWDADNDAPVLKRLVEGGGQWQNWKEVQA